MLKHDFPFDPTYGHDLDALLRVGAPQEPDDYQSFWQQTYRDTLAVPVEPQQKEIACTDASLRVFEIQYTGLDGFRVGGWLTLPKDKPPAWGVVVGHGYGGRAEPDLKWSRCGAAAIFPCARGFHRSARPNLPDNAAWHVIHGIDQRDTYLHRFCVADLWSAASALEVCIPAVKGRLNYAGGSFGGGLGAMAVPWEARFHKALLEVPSFGNHPLRVTCPCVGSGESVRLKYQREPEILNVLAYYDAAVAARHIKVPTLFACAKFDPAVPPPGQFAVHNAMPGQKKLFTRTAGHFPYSEEPHEIQQLDQLIEQWFTGSLSLVASPLS